MNVKFRQWFQKNKSYLILLALPIGFTILFGAAMSPIFVEDIPLAVFDQDHSPSSQTVVDQLKDSSSLHVIEGYESLEEIQEAMMMEELSGCVVIPEGFGKDLKGKKGAKALVLIDGSNLLIGNNLQLYTSTILNTVNASVQMQLLEAGNMVPYEAQQNVFTLNLLDRILYNPQIGYFYYLYGGLLAVFVQQTFLAVTVPVLLKEKGRLKKLPGDPRVKKVYSKKISQLVIRYGLLSMVGMLACLLIAHKFFYYPLQGSLGLTLLLHIVFIACLVGMAFVIAAIFDDITHGVQVIMFFTIPTMLSCGYTWPEQFMAPGFAPVVKAVWPLYYYANPLKDIMLKGVGLDIVGHYLIGGVIFALFWIPVGILFYRQKIRTVKRVEGYKE